MSTAPDMLRAARRLDREAVTALFAQHYARVHRIAHALTGSPVAGQRVVDFVLARGVRSVPGWDKDGDPERWFVHHTVLAARRFAVRDPDPDEDELLTSAREPVPAYAAFVRACRKLPRQQTEAYVLHHGEHFNTRFLAVAMDCSTAAAGVHLNAATAALSAVAVERLEEFTAKLTAAYARLGPVAAVALPAVERIVARRIVPILFLRWVIRLIKLAIFAALIYGAWYARDFLYDIYRSVRGMIGY